MISRSPASQSDTGSCFSSETAPEGSSHETTFQQVTKHTQNAVNFRAATASLFRFLRNTVKVVLTSWWEFYKTLQTTRYLYRQFMTSKVIEEESLNIVWIISRKSSRNIITSQITIIGILKFMKILQSLHVHDVHVSVPAEQQNSTNRHPAPPPSVCESWFIVLDSFNPKSFEFESRIVCWFFTRFPWRHNCSDFLIFFHRKTPETIVKSEYLCREDTETLRRSQNGRTCHRDWVASGRDSTPVVLTDVYSSTFIFDYFNSANLAIKRSYTKVWCSKSQMMPVTSPRKANGTRYWTNWKAVVV